MIPKDKKCLNLPMMKTDNEFSKVKKGTLGNPLKF